MANGFALRPGTGVARVPRIMQMENLECGAVCLQMILAYYGKWIPSEEIRSAAGVSRNGSRAGRLVLAARGYGLKAEGYRIDGVASLRSKAVCPCIIFLSYNHFVVLKGFRGKKAYINDPAWGSITVTDDELEAMYGGVCIFLEPGEGFVKSGKRANMFSRLISETGKRASILVFVLLLSLVMAITLFLQPLLSRIFFDRIVGNHSDQWELVFYLSLAIVSVVRVIGTGIQSFYNLKMQGNLAVAGSMNYMWHVMHLPESFFEQRSIADILRRRDFNEKISFDLVNIASPLIFDTALMFIYLVIMFRISFYLGLAGLVSVVINAVFSTVLFYRRTNSARVIERADGLYSSLTASGMDMIETIKSCGAENGFFEKWATSFAMLVNQRSEDEKNNAILSSFPELINLIFRIGIVATGVYLIIKRQLTLGILVAYLGYFEYLFEPAKKIVTAGDSLSGIRAEMERVCDVLDYPEEENESADLRSEEGHVKLKGRVELKNVTFGYSTYEKPVLKDFSLNIDPGETVAIVGPSGCGKSTVSKLILGLYKPWEGEILFDTVPRESIEGAVFSDSLALVDQSISFFDDTVENNITMWDPTIEDFTFALASIDAALHNEIMQRPGGYDYKITGGGSNFSGGQRQRIEIASALAHEPTIIILDEATSALDASTEKSVMDAIHARRVTCIIIAHRLSTVKACDRIVVMDEGCIIESGNHDELMKKRGAYYNLVSGEEQEAS